VNGSVNFYRNWTEYAYGFGSLTGEFWIGDEIFSLILYRILAMTSIGRKHIIFLCLPLIHNRDAFDSIDHAILLSRLKTSFGFDGLVYHWIESYLTDRSQTVTIGNNSSAPTHVASGVPQGSVLGPLLFSIYTSSIVSIASTFSVPQQQFADDSTLYLSFPIQFPRSNPSS